MPIEGTIQNTLVDIVDLVPLTSYTFTVSALNKFGSGPEASIAVQTLGKGRQILQIELFYLYYCYIIIVYRNIWL